MRARPFLLLLPLVLSACAELGELGIVTPEYAPTQVEGDWAVFANGQEAGRVCWAATHPLAEGGTARKEALVILTTAPELSAQLPDLADSEALVLAVGAKSWPMFAKGGTAWLREDRDEAPVLKALEAAARAKIEGPGGATLAEFSTTGLKAAHGTAAKLCGQ